MIASPFVFANLEEHISQILMDGGAPGIDRQGLLEALDRPIILFGCERVIGFLQGKRQGRRRERKQDNRSQQQP